MAWNIDDVPIFVAVVEHRGVTAAADALGMPKSTVSKALTRLEGDLGLRLLDRNSRNVRITSDGEVFYQHSLRILEQVAEANTVMGGLTAQPRGRLVAALPMAFGREIVAPHLPDFRDRYPEVQLELIITSHTPDIIRDQIDVAVVVGALEDSELIVKPLYKGDLVWVASPGYVAGRALGTTVEDLASHIQICEKRYAEKRLHVKEAGQRKTLDLANKVIQVNDPIAVREAVAAGCGVSLLPRQYTTRDLQSGRLVEVFRDIRMELSASELSAVYPSRRLMSNKARAFLDFLGDICAGL